MVRAFEDLSLPAAELDHAAHVRLAWWYLHTAPLGEALDRFRHALRAFAAAHGVPEKYHETMTVAWMLLVAERVASAPDLDWPRASIDIPKLGTIAPAMGITYGANSARMLADIRLGERNAR